MKNREKKISKKNELVASSKPVGLVGPDQAIEPRFTFWTVKELKVEIGTDQLRPEWELELVPFELTRPGDKTGLSNRDKPVNGPSGMRFRRETEKKIKRTGN